MGTDMAVLGTAREDELDALLAFDHEHAGSDTSMEQFRAQYESYPDLSVVAVEDGKLVAEATGRPGRPEENPIESRPDGIVLQSIAVHPSRHGEGLGRRILEYFEEQALNYAELVSTAAATNVEEFYQNCGYEPRMVLLQVTEADLPENYAQLPGFLDGRTPSPGTRFLYVGFEEYDPELRVELAEAVNAFEANTIYEKEL